MKFKIINHRIDDFIILEAETIEEIQEKGKRECARRGWKDEHVYSEEIK